MKVFKKVFFSLRKHHLLFSKQFIELALAHKEDGNFNFKMKKYRFAIINYTEGLKLKCGNIDIDANLHLNRAAAHFHLQNYRFSIVKLTNFAI